MENYFDLEELLASETALNKKIENLPSWEVVENLKELRDKILNPLRAEYGSAVNVTSGFRSEKLNKAVGGSATSQHRYGNAADIVPADENVKKLFDTAKKMIEEEKITVGQLIDEYDYKWVHISLPTPVKKNQILHLK